MEEEQKKKKKIAAPQQQFRRETAVFVTASTLTCLCNFNLTLSKARIVSLCICLETFLVIVEKILDLVIM